MRDLGRREVKQEFFEGSTDELVTMIVKEEVNEMGYKTKEDINEIHNESTQLSNNEFDTRFQSSLDLQKETDFNLSSVTNTNVRLVTGNCEFIEKQLGVERIKPVLELPTTMVNQRNIIYTPDVTGPLCSMQKLRTIKPRKPSVQQCNNSGTSFEKETLVAHNSSSLIKNKKAVSNRMQTSSKNSNSRMPSTSHDVHDNVGLNSSKKRTRNNRSFRNTKNVNRGKDVPLDTSVSPSNNRTSSTITVMQANTLRTLLLADYEQPKNCSNKRVSNKQIIRPCTVKLSRLESSKLNKSQRSGLSKKSLKNSKDRNADKSVNHPQTPSNSKLLKDNTKKRSVTSDKTNAGAKFKCNEMSNIQKNTTIQTGEIEQISIKCMKVSLPNGQLNKDKIGFKTKMKTLLPKPSIHNLTSQYSNLQPVLTSSPDGNFCPVPAQSTGPSTSFGVLPVTYSTYSCSLLQSALTSSPQNMPTTLSPLTSSGQIINLQQFLTPSSGTLQPTYISGNPIQLTNHLLFPNTGQVKIIQNTGENFKTTPVPHSDTGNTE